MAQWVQWDDETNTMLGIFRHLPAHLEGRSIQHLALLGYRELLTIYPEDRIARFTGLLGTSVFTKGEDGRVRQTFPNADFSVGAVRREIVRLMKQDAGRTLAATDWLIVRQLEIGTPVPADVTALRQRIRDHTDWIEQDVQTKTPRELVDYQWMFPSSPEQRMVNGIPVVTLPPASDEPFPAPSPTPTPVDEVPTTIPDGPRGNADPNVVDPDPPPPPPTAIAPPPPTTDGPVPIFDEKSGETKYLTAEGTPITDGSAPIVAPEDVNPAGPARTNQ